MRDHVFGEHLHLVEQFIEVVGGEIQPQQMGHAGLAQQIRPLDHIFRGANQIDVLMAQRPLILQG